MRTILTLFVLALALYSCQTEAPGTTPEFINFGAIEDNANLITADRKSEAFRGKVQITTLNDEVVIIVDEASTSRSIAYVLQTETRADLATFSMDNAWVIFLQDHLLLFDEGSDRRIRLSIGNRPLDTPVVSESITFTELVKGYGLARYPDQGVRPEDLEETDSYLEARSNR